MHQTLCLTNLNRFAALFKFFTFLVICVVWNFPILSYCSCCSFQNQLDINFLVEKLGLHTESIMKNVHILRAQSPFQYFVLYSLIVLSFVNDSVNSVKTISAVAFRRDKIFGVTSMLHVTLFLQPLIECLESTWSCVCGIRLCKCISEDDLQFILYVLVFLVITINHCLQISCSILRGSDL